METDELNEMPIIITLALALQIFYSGFCLHQTVDKCPFGLLSDTVIYLWPGTARIFAG